MSSGDLSSEPAASVQRIIPEIFVHDGLGALEFYRRAFGAEERSRMLAPDGQRLLHAELLILGQRLFLCDEFRAEEGGTCRSPRSLGGTPVRLMLEVDDADRTVERAAAAGARVLLPVQDMFWGARYGKLMDPYGHEWGINQQQRQPSSEQEAAEAKRFFDKK